MSTIITIIIVAIVIVVLVQTLYKGNSSNNIAKLQFSENDFDIIRNDKIILIEGPIYNEVKSACMDFCEQYNKETFNVIIKIIRLDPTTCLLVFPYEIDFSTYCYLVNYLEYPINQKYNAKVTGWLTSKRIDEWIESRSVNKKIMVYNSYDLELSDCVLYTTMDQIGYKIDFSSEKNPSEMENPERMFEPCNKIIEDPYFIKGETITGLE